MFWFSAPLTNQPDTTDITDGDRSKGSHHADRFEEDGKTWELQRHVSFVDCPGHDILMATMLNGAAVREIQYIYYVIYICIWY